MSRNQTFHFPVSLSRAHYGMLVTIVLAIFFSVGMALLNFLPARGLTSSLPGQQIWRDGVSSYLFGTNEVAWEPLALSNSAIMATVKAAGVPLVRVPLTAQNADQRVRLIEQSGAKCLGIVSWHHPDDALKVVQMLGNRCQLYEFGNEPESLSDYITAWNDNIATLRQANPGAKFIGPVLASPDANGIRKFLSAVRSNPPDVVSWHMYPCTDRTLQSCEQGQHINFSKHTQEIGAVIQSVLGHDVPQAITEYNYDWQDGKTPNRDTATMQQFTTAALNDMIQASKYGLIMANEYQLGGRAGGGTLDMVDPVSGAPLAQFSVLSRFIATYRLGSAPVQPTAVSTLAATSTKTPCANTSDNTDGGSTETAGSQSFPVTIASRSFCCALPAWMVADSNGQESATPVDTTKREIQCTLVDPATQQTTTITSTVTVTVTSTATATTSSPTPTVTPSPTSAEKPVVVPLLTPTPVSSDGG